jgi:hypothetical protein
MLWYKAKRKKKPNIEIDKLYDFFQNLNTRDICDGNDGLPEVNNSKSPMLKINTTDLIDIWK